MTGMAWTVETLSAADAEIKALPGARDRQGKDEAGDTMTKLKDLKARLMEDSEFREEYERIDGKYALIEALVCAHCGEADASGARQQTRHNPVGGRAAGERACVAVICHAAALRRGNGDEADRGSGAGRRLSPGMPACRRQGVGSFPT